MKSFSSHNRNFYVVGTSNVQRNVKKDQKINEEKNILTRVCFVFSPQFIKSSLENSQAITCFSRWYSRNHGTSTVQQRKSTVNEKTLSSGGSREGPEGRKKFFWRPPPPPPPPLRQRVTVHCYPRMLTGALPRGLMNLQLHISSCITNHFETGPSGNKLIFWPRISMFPSATKLTVSLGTSH